MPVPDGTTAASPPPADGLDLSIPRHVRALYLDTLGRTPDADELELAAASRPSMLLRLLCGSHGFWQHWYEEQLYYFLLLDNFRPHDPGPGKRLADLLAASELDAAGAVRAIVLSSAFHRANPGNDTFVSVVFEQLLGMTVQREPALLGAGKRMYDGHRASLWGSTGSCQADIVSITCAQSAFVECFVAREHRRITGREPSRDDLKRWTRDLMDHPDEFPELARQWFLSETYASRLQRLRRKTDRQFLQGLFVDLTGRAPDGDTLARCRRALSAVADGGPLRSVIARVLLQSEEVDLPARADMPPDSLVALVFRRFLGRDPDLEEAALFVNIFEQCGCETDTLVRAVTTHWEYQYY